jgi:hypothetical protein
LPFLSHRLGNTNFVEQPGIGAGIDPDEMEQAVPDVGLQLGQGRRGRGSVEASNGERLEARVIDDRRRQQRLSVI